MLLRTGPLALLATLLTVASASAQVVVGPLPGDPGYGGVRITYHRGGLTISAGYALYPPPPGYLVVGPSYAPPVIVKSSPSPRITINNYYGSNPPVLGPGYADDTRGYDLDATPVKKKEPTEPVKPETPREMPGVEISKSKPPVRPEDVKPEPKEPGPKPPGPPVKVNPREEYAQLIQLGVQAFADGEYGLAALRFRQASKVDGTLSGAYFLLSQAEFALGKYRDAVATIHTGMKLDKKWPSLIVHPRVDLYKDQAAEFAAHLKRLEAEVAAQPNQPTLLFLLAHQLWFDGRRPDALALFQRARPLTQDRTYIDVFLAAGGPGPLAAN
jgi:hypothetical protein